MKCRTILLTAVAAAFLMAACSSPSDALDDYPRYVQEEPLTPEELSQELAAKMATSAWTEQLRPVTVAFGCEDISLTYLSFNALEKVHRIFASDGNVYFVVSGVSLSDKLVEDDAGNQYNIEFVINNPEAESIKSMKLHQHLKLTVIGNGIMQEFESERPVLTKIAPIEPDDEGNAYSFFKAGERYAALAEADDDLSRTIPEAVLGSCSGDF